MKTLLWIIAGAMMAAAVVAFWIQFLAAAVGQSDDEAADKEADDRDL